MEDLNKKVVNKLKNLNKTISFMESCTGGYLANTITNVSGASNVLKASLVTYSNEYKIKFGVSKETIDKYTVYSSEVADEMAKKVAEFTKSDYGIGITGELANPKKEENKVYYSIYNTDNNKTIINRFLFVEPNDRDKMKDDISNNVLEDLWNILMKN